MTQLLIHAANLAFLVSFLVRDILALRLLSVTGGGLLLASFLATSPVSWPSVGWNVVFSLINGMQIVRLVRERRPVRLTRDERELAEGAFAALPARDVRRLAKTASFETSARGATLVEQGCAPDALWLVLEGTIEIHAEAGRLATLGPGHFVGEMCFLTGAAPRASARVASKHARLARFDCVGLRALLDSDAALRAAVQSVLGADLAAKLRAQPEPQRVRQSG
jgi:CRP-like cAMP-binding protein